LHEAQLPVPKTLADYDWNAIPDLERPQIEQIAHDTGWLDRAENLLLFGPSGVCPATMKLAGALHQQIVTRYSCHLATLRFPRPGQGHSPE
jgi:DNA replication protein DnaC